MPVELAVLYADESLRLCKEYASFLKKRQAFEMEYAKNMAKLAHTIQKFHSSSGFQLPGQQPDKRVQFIRSQLLKSSLWSQYADNIDQCSNLARSHAKMAQQLSTLVIEPLLDQIKEMEIASKQAGLKATQLTTRLNDALSATRRAKKELDAQQVVAIEANQNHQRAQYNPNTKEKDLSRLLQKSLTATEKAELASEQHLQAEQRAKEVQEEHYNSSLPAFYKHLKLEETNRCKFILQMFQIVQRLEINMISFCNSSNTKATTTLEQIDIASDIHLFETFHMTDRMETNIKPSMMGLGSTSTGIISKSGMLLMKRDDMNPSWKQRFVAFREEDKTLSIYDRQEAPRPREVLKMSECSIHPISASYFGKPCFQITNRQSYGDAPVFKFVGDTQDEINDWFQYLSMYCYCCSTCAQVYGYDPVSKTNTVIRDKTPKRVYSLSLNIMNARDLRTSNGSKAISPYCLVLLDDIKYSRTSMKTSENPIWNEEFEIPELCPHWTKLRIALFNGHKTQKDAHIGFLVISLDQLPVGTKVDEWHPIYQLTGNRSEVNSQPVGSIRLQYTLKTEQTLTEQQAEELLDLLVDPPNYLCIKQLFRQVVDRDQFARAVVHCLLVKEVQDESLQFLIGEDISSTEDPNIIFRGNTLAIKLLDQYMKIVGKDYLKKILDPLVSSVYQFKDGCEIDPTRTDPDTARRNVVRIYTIVTTFWKSLQKNVEQFPKDIVQIMQFIKQQTALKFGGEDTKLLAVSSMVFLRFICPCIVTPQQFGIIVDAPDANQSKTLTTIAKILQNLANLKPMVAKDSISRDLSVFVDEEKQNMKIYLEHTLSPVFDAQPLLLLPDIVIDDHLKIMYHAALSQMDQLAKENDPKIIRLLSLVRSIKGIMTKPSLEIQKVSESDITAFSSVRERPPSMDDVTSTRDSLEREPSPPPTNNRGLAKLAMDKRRSKSLEGPGEEAKSPMDAYLPNVAETANFSGAIFQEVDNMFKDLTTNE